MQCCFNQVNTQGNSFQNCTGGQRPYLRSGVLNPKLSKQNETTLKRSDFLKHLLAIKSWVKTLLLTCKLKYL